MKKKNLVTPNEEKPVFLDQQGYDELVASIEELTLRIRENNKGRRDAFTSETNDGCVSSAFIEIERVDFMLSSELQRKREILSRAVIVKADENSEIINIGDVISVSLLTKGEEVNTRLFKLVGGMPNFESGAIIQEISINSPMGASIYQKSVGDTCSYTVNNNTFTVIIHEKVDLSKTEDVKVRKLTKND